MSRSQVDELFLLLRAKYTQIYELSHWQNLRRLNNMDDIDRSVSEREQCILDATDLFQQIKDLCGNEEAHTHPLFSEVSRIRDEILSFDELFTTKIAERMAEIKNELRQKILFSSHALPCYMKQKSALAR